MTNINKIVKNLADISLLIIFIAMIIGRIASSYVFILIMLAGMISLIGFMILVLFGKTNNGNLG